MSMSSTGQAEANPRRHLAKLLRGLSIDRVVDALIHVDCGLNGREFNATSDALSESTVKFALPIVERCVSTLRDVDREQGYAMASILRWAPGMASRFVQCIRQLETNPPASWTLSIDSRTIQPSQ
jgi:hypothetical protein